MFLLLTKLIIDKKKVIEEPIYIMVYINFDKNLQKKIKKICFLNFDQGYSHGALEHNQIWLARLKALSNVRVRAFSYLSRLLRVS